MLNQTNTPIIKIFICGEGGVGKTTLIERLIKGVFNSNTIITIGVQHSLYKMTTPKGKKVALQIWDLGGEERFKVIIPIYVRGSSGGLIVFDESRYPTYKNLIEWIELVKRDINPETPLLLLSCKADLVKEQLVPDKEINEFLKTHGLRAYIRTSAKEGYNIKDAFEKLLGILEEENLL